MVSDLPVYMITFNTQRQYRRLTNENRMLQPTRTCTGNDIYVNKVINKKLMRSRKM